METTEERVYGSQPQSPYDKKVQEKFAEDIAHQSRLMEEMAKLLISIELAIPGIYATVLKLIAGEKATMETGFALGLTFLLWFMALVLSFLAIFPQRYTVDKNNLKAIEDFYHRSAKHKAHFLIGSVVLFFGGIACSVFAL